MKRTTNQRCVIRSLRITWVLVLLLGPMSGASAVELLLRGSFEEPAAVGLNEYRAVSIGVADIPELAYLDPGREQVFLRLTYSYGGNPPVLLHLDRVRRTAGFTLGFYLPLAVPELVYELFGSAGNMTGIIALAGI